MTYLGVACPGRTKRDMGKERMLVKRCGIAFETLADYHDGQADATTTTLVRAHLEADCAHCRENLAWLQNATGTLREADRVQVPATMLDRAHALFRERFRIPERVSWLARLQFDSRSNSLALAGARGASADPFQLIYSTDEHDVELFQEPTEQGTWYVIGQVLPRVGEAVIVPSEIVLTGIDGMTLTFAPQTQEFHLPSVPTGIYQMALRLPEGDITMSDVGVGR